MNTAYWIALIWGVLALLATFFTHGRNTPIVALLIVAATLASLLGVAVQYQLI